MPFLAATAGGHHTYPGGLVDHTLFNLRSGLALAADYAHTYGIQLDEDLVRAAAIRHDAAKTWTIRWNDDGTLAREGQIAGTGAHHILGVAEMLARGWPARAVVSLASAHSPPHPGDELAALLRYLRAAAIIAGKTYAEAGLSEDGKSLAEPAPIEAFVNHLSDHDYVLTETTAQAAAGEPADRWARAAELAREPDVVRYWNRRRRP
jgi:hypothetical protein